MSCGGTCTTETTETRGILDCPRCTGSCWAAPGPTEVPQERKHDPGRQEEAKRKETHCEKESDKCHGSDSRNGRARCSGQVLRRLRREGPAWKLRWRSTHRAGRTPHTCSCRRSMARFTRAHCTHRLPCGRREEQRAHWMTACIARKHDQVRFVPQRACCRGADGHRGLFRTHGQFRACSPVKARASHKACCLPQRLHGLGLACA